MDYYRFGTCTGMTAPGGNVLLGLMGQLSTPTGMAPEQLLLAEGRMNGGIRSFPAVNTCELFVYVIDGSVLVSTGEEEVRLISDNIVRIPAGMRYQLSTIGSVGMTGLLIVPLQSEVINRKALFACCGEALTLRGEPRPLPMSSLADLRSLTRLTCEGCVLPSVQMVRGNFNRDVLLATLLPQYAEDPRALRAFIRACNAQPAAPWWLDRKRAKIAIEEGVAEEVAKLLAS